MTATELRAAESRLLASANRLSDADVRAPSRLPGWSRGHVLTHLARNADGMGNLVGWAATGVRTPMYPGPEARADAIEAGSGRSAEDLVADVEGAAAALAQALVELPETALDAVVTFGAAGTPVRGSELVLMRIREVEIHHVDLDVGYEPAAWSTEFASRSLDQLTPAFRAGGQVPVAVLAATDTRLRWVVADQGDELAGSSASLLAWLVGRIPSQPGTAAAATDLAGLELSGGGPVPSPPPWV